MIKFKESEIRALEEKLAELEKRKIKGLLHKTLKDKKSIQKLLKFHFFLGNKHAEDNL